MIERATKGRLTDTHLRRMTVNGRSEMLPSDPFEVAKILRERRAKSPAVRARAHILKGMRKRGVKT
jgi:hypothetical protein